MAGKTLRIAFSKQFGHLSHWIPPTMVSYPILSEKVPGIPTFIVNVGPERGWGKKKIVGDSLPPMADRTAFSDKIGIKTKQIIISCSRTVERLAGGVRISPMNLPDQSSAPQKRVAVFGSTGSIGTSTLDVVRHGRGRFVIGGLSAHSRLQELCEQAKEFSPDWIVATDEEKASRFAWPALPGTDVLVGKSALESIAQTSSVEIVVAAIVGLAGLKSTWAALESGKDVALANKETLVAAGPLVMELTRQKGCRLLPIDSEHNAIFQCLEAGNRDEIATIYLTASGGPFRDLPLEQMRTVSPEQALNHPTWSMGRKISVDSATMMNKALEIIEARWLFDLKPSQIEVVVHPQSIVHSMVEFIDGSVIAQMSPPDMKLPIQHALSYPERQEGSSPRLNFRESIQLEFAPPDRQRFPALDLGRKVASLAGTAGAVFNASNEIAVEAFLQNKILFTDIVTACQAVLEKHPFCPAPSFEQVLEADRWARQETEHWISTLSNLV